MSNFRLRFRAWFVNLTSANLKFATYALAPKETTQASFERLNGADEYGGKWWPGEARPANLIVFAVGDPWIFLLDCADGAIYAWLIGDEELCGRRIASDFERFFIALASVGIARLSKKAVPCAEKIAKFVQADDDNAIEFWREMAEI